MKNTDTSADEDPEVNSETEVDVTPHDAGGGTNHPISGRNDRWETVIEDMSATATEYREAGWETVEVHPGDILPLPPVDGTDVTDITTPQDDDENPSDEMNTNSDERIDDTRVGLDVIVPTNEFERVAAATSGTTFDSYESFRAEVGSILFVVAAIKSSAHDIAVFVPLYYRADDAQLMAEHALSRGEIDIFLRPLSNDRQVVFTQSDPELLLPQGMAK
jgi:hypothetical protein